MDIIGFEYYYWMHVPSEETSYNQYDELEVTMKAKIDLLEQIVREMKAKL